MSNVERLSVAPDDSRYKRGQLDRSAFGDAKEFALTSSL
jgi:hypothetical protein